MPSKKRPPVKDIQYSLFNGEQKVILPKATGLKKSNFTLLREKHFFKLIDKENFLKLKTKIFEDIKSRYNRYDANVKNHNEVAFSQNLIKDVRTDIIKRINLLQEFLINNIEEQVKNNRILNNKENKALYRLLLGYKRSGKVLLEKLDKIDADIYFIESKGADERRNIQSSQDVKEIAEAIERKLSTLDEKKQKFIGDYCTFRAKYSIISKIEFLNEFGPRFNLKFK